MSLTELYDRTCFLLNIWHGFHPHTYHNLEISKMAAPAFINQLDSEDTTCFPFKTRTLIFVTIHILRVVDESHRAEFSWEHVHCVVRDFW